MKSMEGDPAAVRPSSDRPTFCARCKKSATPSPSGTACPECGDALRPRGYCQVCEDYRLLPVGATCPKHEIELDGEGPPREHPAVAGGPSTWVTVMTLADAVGVAPARIRLEAEGIPTLVEGERMGSRSMYQVATGGIRLKVPEPLAAEARVILSQTWRATAAELGIDEIDGEEKDDVDDHDERPREIPAEELPAEAAPVRNALFLFLAGGVPCLLLLIYLAVHDWL
ncbi:hypothetical protein OJF2_59580 [Aquisphaera giovannonii]|uniref:DUF2007 domain-containing protein n=1 Tax=Aquisphaera giovannonii TaxID=406548 RepID=A0A5B9W9Q6_9BACT|nr:DUF2007 domain-containing protein [Aquisphaera giovannonii]QEH37368.1 hypothetical protein OJF2_59580 [Aquisphaera giovannonii]